ncbi:hypothetical protein KD050_18930 [Psychrobacillus sp. INOP01]|uniref:DUF6932 family protein n=1 Tax=Psychrobacillus sp. INOP01 TaxID=2829187 RepID=UPI001BA70BBB|nr:hypothetical protein [Psychrobacillus sp. INOP01]QUG41325.1 hypothetical protein KD050_18930 [Psychrobacillus sp. INOP01]
MTIPDFIDRYHLPDGDHECTMEEIEEKFLFSETRERKWKQFSAMLYRMSELGLKPKKVLINGSFVTGRENPGDVDFAALIPPETVISALENAEDDHDLSGIELFMGRNNQLALRNLFGAHLLIADSEEMLSGWSTFFRKGQNGILREPDPEKDPEWVVRPDVKGILKVSTE